MRTRKILLLVSSLGLAIIAIEAVDPWAVRRPEYSRALQAPEVDLGPADNAEWDARGMPETPPEAVVAGSSGREEEGPYDAPWEDRDEDDELTGGSGTHAPTDAPTDASSDEPIEPPGDNEDEDQNNPPEVTLRPTTTPTTAPTPEPTAAPTEAPTAETTKKHTPAPTNKKTHKPTSAYRHLHCQALGPGHQQHQDHPDHPQPHHQQS